MATIKFWNGLGTDYVMPVSQLDPAANQWVAVIGNAAPQVWTEGRIDIPNNGVVSFRYQCRAENPYYVTCSVDTSTNPWTLDMTGGSTYKKEMQLDGTECLFTFGSYE